MPTDAEPSAPIDDVRVVTTTYAPFLTAIVRRGDHPRASRGMAGRFLVCSFRRTNFCALSQTEVSSELAIRRTALRCSSSGSVCQPGEASCSGGKAKACRADGSGYVEFECDPVPGMTCEPSGCKGQCAETWTVASYIGCDYYPTVTLNPVWSGFDFAVAVGNASDRYGPRALERSHVAARFDRRNHRRSAGCLGELGGGRLGRRPRRNHPPLAQRHLGARVQQRRWNDERAPRHLGSGGQGHLGRRRRADSALRRRPGRRRHGEGLFAERRGSSRPVSGPGNRWMVLHWDGSSGSGRGAPTAPNATGDGRVFAGRTARSCGTAP
jgi:hypothetical protein